MRTGFSAVPAAILTFFSLTTSAGNDRHEIHCAIIFDFVIIGPLWAIVAYRSYRVGRNSRFSRPWPLGSFRPPC